MMQGIITGLPQWAGCRCHASTRPEGVALEVERCERHHGTSHASKLQSGSYEPYEQ